MSRSTTDCDGKTLNVGDDVVIKRGCEIQGRVVKVHGTHSASIAVWDCGENREVVFRIDTSWKCWSNVTENKTTLSEIKEIPIEKNGRCYASGILQNLQDFAHDTSNSMTERRAALVYMSEVMGAEIEEEETRMTDRQVVEHYISECASESQALGFADPQQTR